MSDSQLGVQRQEVLGAVPAWTSEERGLSGVRSMPTDRKQWSLCPGSTYEPCGSQKDWDSSRFLPPEDPLEG